MKEYRQMRPSNDNDAPEKVLPFLKRGNRKSRFSELLTRRGRKLLEIRPGISIKPGDIVIFQDTNIPNPYSITVNGEKYTWMTFLANKKLSDTIRLLLNKPETEFEVIKIDPLKPKTGLIISKTFVLGRTNIIVSFPLERKYLEKKV